MINTIDLFTGCGGLTEGFKQNGNYNMIACVEWDKTPYNTLFHRLKTKWNFEDVDKRVLRYDIQKTSNLLNGWDDEYGKSVGLNKLVSCYGGGVDLIIGGPPCQAYSIAGRVRDENGMKNDYRNYLYEHYIDIVKHFAPKAFIFENVPGMLSATPGDGNERIINRVKKQFAKIGYSLINNITDTVIDFTEYGVPQKRKRLIILGLNERSFGSKTSKTLTDFYFNFLPEHKVKSTKTVSDAISDLPKLFPLENPIKRNGKQYSHTLSSDNHISNHTPRYNNSREIGIFKLLADDIQNKKYEYTSADALKKLYTAQTGRKSNVHKYYVLRWDEPSNTIPAHLYKDGLRHIHPDPEQARSITVREAARLQTFPDDFEFVSNTAMDYKIIGNAVPPLFAKTLADSLQHILQ